MGCPIHILAPYSFLQHSNFQKVNSERTPWKQKCCVLCGTQFHELHTVQVLKIWKNTLNFHFHLLLRKYVPCSISPNNSRWHNSRVRDILHSELYASQPLTIPLFPFYFVSHLDHLRISFKIGGIC